MVGGRRFALTAQMPETAARVASLSTLAATVASLAAAVTSSTSTTVAATPATVPTTAVLAALRAVACDVADLTALVALLAATATSAAAETAGALSGRRWAVAGKMSRVAAVVAGLQEVSVKESGCDVVGVPYPWQARCTRERDGRIDRSCSMSVRSAESPQTVGMCGPTGVPLFGQSRAWWVVSPPGEVLVLNPSSLLSSAGCWA